MLSLSLSQGCDDLRQTVKRQVETINVNELNLSPWTFQVLKKELSRKKPDSEHILISDLTRGFTRPNIVDIKLGTLHHSQARATLKPTKYGTAISLGYCIAESTPVALADGTSLRIEQLAALRGQTLASPSAARRQLDFARCSAAFASGVKHCIRVTLSDGRALECTPDHRLMAADGSFVAAGLVVAGVSQLAVSPLLAPLPLACDDALDSRLLACMRLAGRVGASRIDRCGAATLCAAAELDLDAMLRDIAAVQLDQAVLQVRPTLRLSGAATRALSALSSSLSDAPLGAAREFLGAALGATSAMLQLDASALVFACSSSRESERLLALLARCGVCARAATGAAIAVDVESFCERVGFRYAVALQRRLSALCIAKRLRGSATIDERLRSIGFADGDGDDDKSLALLWLTVVHVEAIGARRVYDLTVPGNATFVAAGVCVHNCIGGMMVWNDEASSYSHLDKYVGRKLTDSTIGGVLELFFAPAGRVLVKALVPVIHKLRALLSIFNEQTAWRFHSTSLLVIYEGARRVASAMGTEGRVSVALVDFAHAYMNHPGVEGRTPQVDTGCRLGIGNVIALLENFARSTASAKRHTEWSSTVKWRSLPSYDHEASSDHEDAMTEYSTSDEGDANDDANDDDDEDEEEKSDASDGENGGNTGKSTPVRTRTLATSEEPRRCRSVSDMEQLARRSKKKVSADVRARAFAAEDVEPLFEE